MSFIIDIALIFLLALCVYIGWVRGFVKTLSGFLTYVLSFAIANATYRFLSAFVMRLPFLQKMAGDVDASVFSENATFLDKIKEILSVAKESAFSGNAGEAVGTAKEMLGYCVAEMLSCVIAFALIFALSVALLKLLIWLFDLYVKKLPVINKANGILGAIVGLLNGFIWTWSISNIFVRFAFPVLHYVWPDVFVYEMTESFVLNLCTKINPITYLFELINLIS